ncbi:MAG: cytochrome P450, partial [Rhodothermales bacterium]
SDELLPQRRAELAQDPSLDDVVSRLLKLELPESVGFGEEQILPNIMGLLVGGVETTSQAVVQILDQLFRRPKALEGARRAARHDDDRRVFRYCWEALRFNPINPFVMRQCNQDYLVAAGTFRNKKIRQGRVVLVGTRSAMKDGRELPRPHTFSVDRPDYHYMHLGYGSHRCLGDQVSKVQVPQIVKTLFLKENLRRAPGAAGRIDYGDGPFPERFTVTFDR